MKKITLLLSLILCVAFANAQTANYVFSETTGNTFTSISSTGTFAAGVSAADDDDELVNIGFNFTYDSTVYTQMNIGSNGYCAFGSNSATSVSNDLASTAVGKMDVVSLHWDDLDPAASGDIYYETQGTAPNRVFIIEYNAVKDYSTAYYIMGQIVLYEGSNNIELRYGAATGTPIGIKASVGINESPGGLGHFISVTPGTPATVSTTTSNNNITAQPADGVNYLFSAPVPQPYDFTMLANTNSQSGNPTYNVAYEMYISNLGANNDTFDLAISGNNWPALIRDKTGLNTITELAVASGTVDTFLVNVNVPGAALCGDMDSIHVTATSQGLPTNNHTETLTTKAIVIPTAITTLPWIEDFEGECLPFSMEDSAGTGNVWLRDDFFTSTYVSLGPDHYFSASSDGDGNSLGWDSWLVTVPIYLTQAGLNDAFLQFTSNFQDYAGAGEAWLNITNDHRATWTNLLYMTNDDYERNFNFDLSAYVGDTIQIAWRYSDNNHGDAWRWNIDDIMLYSSNDADIVITELMYNSPETGVDSLEFIEFYNNSPFSVFMKDYTYEYNGGLIHTQDSVWFAADEYVCIAEDSAVFENFYGVTPIQMSNAAAFYGYSNSGNRSLVLKNPSGTIVDSVLYDDSGVWPTEPDGNGPSLVLCDVTSDNNDGANWSYSTTYVDTNAAGDTIWASPTAMDSTCYVVDIAFSNPPSGSGYTFAVCDASSNASVETDLINNGTIDLLAGDTIFLSYQFDANPVVLETLILTTGFDAGSILHFSFSQTIDLSVDGDYNFVLTLNAEDDVNLLNDTAKGVVSNFVVDVNLPGFNDTLYTATYPVTIDAGATTSGGWSYSNWDWSTSAITQTINVSTDGWYYVTVTTAPDSSGSQCTAVDSVYVILGTGLREYEVGMNVYPNPNSGTFTVVFDGNTNGTVLTIMNIQGQIIREEELSGDAVKQIDMSAEPKGIYFIRVMNEHSTKVERVIVQ